MLLSFDKPAKLRSTQEHNELNSSDCEIAGTYQPNMSQEDMERWKAKHFNQGKNNARIEVRKTFEGTQVVLIVALDGWDFKHEQISARAGTYNCTKGLNVRMSMNGPLKLTFDHFAEIQMAVDEAREILENSKL